MTLVKKKVVILSGDGNTVYWFRRELISDFQKIDYDVHVIAPDIKEEFLETFHSMKVKFSKLSLKRKTINFLDSFTSFLSIKRILENISPDIFIVYTLKSVFLSGLCLYFSSIQNSTALITGTGHIFHNKSYLGVFKKLLVIAALKISMPSYRLVFFQNPDDRDTFLKYQIVKINQIRMMNGSGVNLEIFRQVDLVADPVFLCISRLIKSKGLFEYAEAAKIVKSTHPKARFLLFGYPDAHSDSIDEQEIINCWSEKYGIEYHGFSQIPENTIAQASIFVLLSHHEGTPRVVLEAMAMGRPIITTNAPGCKETVEEGVNGFKVPVGDSKSAALQMIKLINPDLRTSMGKASRKIAEEKFDVIKVNKNLIKEICC
jgi:glycosyltransferase involved in cell wall biosynthesis